MDPQLLVITLLESLPRLVGQPASTDIGDTARLAQRLAASNARVKTLPACPLMHGTGMVIGMHTALALGGTMVLLDKRHFDPAELWEAVEREEVTIVAVVGDPFARPMLAELEGRDAAGSDGASGEAGTTAWDLSSLRFISSSGAMFSGEVKRALIERIPQLTILDYISSTEGLMGVSISTTATVAETGVFRPAPGVRVFAEDGSEVAAGSGDAGVVGLTTGVPEGYYKDEAKSARTFREVQGIRYSFPGDWATVDHDGSLRLMGRGSGCINTGGEKVYPEEVEEVIKRHPAVADCVVLGLPDERFGQSVAAVASLVADVGAPTEDILREACTVLAAYKVPRQLQLVTEVPRTPSGKADYQAARALLRSSSPAD